MYNQQKRFMASLDERIELWIERIESEQIFSDMIEKMEDDRPDLLAYFYLPQFEDLSEDEGSFLIFLATLIYAAYTDGGQEELPEIDLHKIQEHEDESWNMWEALPGKSFEDKISHLPDAFWDPVTDLIVTMVENDEDSEPDWPQAVQEIFFVSLLSFYRSIAH